MFFSFIDKLINVLDREKIENNDTLQIFHYQSCLWIQCILPTASKRLQVNSNGSVNHNSENREEIRLLILQLVLKLIKSLHFLLISSLNVNLNWIELLKQIPIEEMENLIKFSLTDSFDEIKKVKFFKYN